MVNKKNTPRKLQALRTRKKIYNASIKLIREHGFDSVTIESISKRAGVSVGAFYHYFRTKSDILIEVFSQIDEYFENEVDPKLQNISTHEKIKEFFASYSKFIISQGIDFIKQLYTTKNKLFIKKDRYLYTYLSSIIQTGQDNSEITNEFTDEEIMGFLFIFARGVVFDWCLHDGDYDLQNAFSTHLDRILKIFLSRPATQKEVEERNTGIVG